MFGDPNKWAHPLVNIPQLRDLHAWVCRRDHRVPNTIRHLNEFVVRWAPVNQSRNGISCTRRKPRLAELNSGLRKMLDELNASGVGLRDESALIIPRPLNSVYGFPFGF